MPVDEAAGDCRPRHHLPNYQYRSTDPNEGEGRRAPEMHRGPGGTMNAAQQWPRRFQGLTMRGEGTGFNLHARFGFKLRADLQI